MGVVLTRPAPMVGVLTRPAGLTGAFTLQALQGSLTRPAPLVGALTRPAPLVGVFVEDWRPLDAPAGSIQVGDLGDWRPRIRGVLGAGEEGTPWKLLGHTLYSGGSTSQGPRGINPPPFSSVAVSAALGLPEPAHYVPGPLRPPDEVGRTTDTIRVTDATAATRDVFALFGGGIVHGGQELTVPIGTDGVAALYAGGELALTASGGTGPYVWDFVVNRSGGTLSAAGAYVAGPDIGIDRLRVTDSLGAVGLVQAEVIPGEIAGDLTETDEDYWRFRIAGYQCIPHARIWGTGGVAPYTIELLDNQTGGTIVPAWEEEAEGPSTRVRFEPLDAAGQRVNVRRLDMKARALRADGIVVGEVVVHPVSDWAVEMILPSPDGLGLWETHLVLEVEATPADGGEVVVVQALFESPSEPA